MVCYIKTIIIKKLISYFSKIVSLLFLVSILNNVICLICNNNKNHLIEIQHNSEIEIEDIEIELDEIVDLESFNIHDLKKIKSSILCENTLIYTYHFDLESPPPELV